MSNHNAVMPPSLDRNWGAPSGAPLDVETMMERFCALPYRAQVAVLLDLDLLWTEDLGALPTQQRLCTIERAREYGLLSALDASIRVAQECPISFIEANL